MTPEERDVMQGYLQNACAELKQHFDTVQIFCTKDEQGDDIVCAYNQGSGNWYARYGQARLWLKQKESEDYYEDEEDEDED